MGQTESQWFLGHFNGPCGECPASLSGGLKLDLQGFTRPTASDSLEQGPKICILCSFFR